MYNFSRMEKVALFPTHKGWASANGKVTVRLINGVPAFTTSRTTDQELFWDDRPGYKHWSCEVSFGGDDQYMIIIKAVEANEQLSMYWENSY